MKKPLVFFSQIGCILWMPIILLATFTTPLHGQAPSTLNSSDLFLQLKKLNVLGSVLYIAAHPDDENNSLLPYLAKEKLYRTAYLSLTRGDGGQNLIGSEQGVELGLIRTQELVAARNIDGAEQYFTSAYEFGFSKSTEEALSIWNRKKVLGDMVWVIRKFQPDVMITRFPPDARAGHGHHSASAVLAQEAFYAAADPNQYPEQLSMGVSVWQAKRILWNTFNFGGTNTTSNDQFSMEIGGYNAILGKSYGEIGAEARTMHKSQGEGRPRRRGSIKEFFLPVQGSIPKQELLDEVNIHWSRIDPSGNIQKTIDQILSNYQPTLPSASVAPLVQLYQQIAQLPPSVWKNQKLLETQNLVEACAGIYLEATTNQEKWVQGQNMNVSILLNKRLPSTVKLNRVQLVNFDSVFSNLLNTNLNLSFNKEVTIPEDQPISQPYWLALPKEEGGFVIQDQKNVGKPQNDPSFEAIFELSIEGSPFVFRRPLQYKYVDPERGELYQPLVILPKGELQFDQENNLLIGSNKKSVTVLVKNNSQNKIAEPFQVTSPQYFTQHSQTSNGDHTTLLFSSQKRNENFSETIEVKATNSHFYAGSMKQINYHHIPTLTYFTPAKTHLVSLQVKTKGKRIGYIEGAGDRVPEALEALGYQVERIDENQLTDKKLKGLDAVIIGIRAANLHEYLTNKNEVLCRYVANGGNLIAQYIKSNLVGNKKLKIGPYPFTIGTSARVTQEQAAVNFLLPNHVFFHHPNTIQKSDFEGWTQERSTYQIEQADPAFEMPIGMQDANEKESKGSLGIAKYGKGNFVYLSLVLFRQLPAGVPGAYRILANLISLPQNK